MGIGRRSGEGRRSAAGGPPVRGTGGRHGATGRRWPDAAEYGELWADDYDRLTGVPPGWTDATVAGLARLAGGGSVLEVAAGTGRVAILLARLGLDVTATDASPKMLGCLAGKQGGDLPRTRVEVLPAVTGDDYAVIAILSNSLWVLETAGAQQDFLHHAARCLAPGGVVAVEMSVVDLDRWREPRRLTHGGVTATLTTVWDAGTQQARHTFDFPPEIRPSRREVHIRYLLPDQLLAMAGAAGLVPRQLWSDWHGAPFTPDSGMLVAVLRRDGDPPAG